MFNKKEVAGKPTRRLEKSRPGPTVAPDEIHAGPQLPDLSTDSQSPLQRTILRYIEALEPVPSEILRLAFEEAEEQRCRRLEEERQALLELREAYAESARLLVPEQLSDGGK